MKTPKETKKVMSTKGVRALPDRQDADELKVMPGYQTHEQLFQVLKELPTDYAPYGKMERRDLGDCSCGCRWYHLLAGKRGSDWGVCADPASPRSGLLTFEHRGCPQFQRDVRWNFLDTKTGQRARQRFEDREEELRQWRKEHPFKTVRVVQRRVGIFWLVGNRLLCDTGPLSKAEEYGECLTHPQSHIDHWAHLQQIGTVSPHSEYEEYPRGRVVFNTKTERFTIYADRCILRRQPMIKRIMKIMHLGINETDFRTDGHYRCVKCMEKLDDDENDI
jgi:hypothetical protein